MEKILIIGGNAAGLTAGSRAKRLDPRLGVTVLERGPFISYSTCGIPYFLSNLVKSDDLIGYTPGSLGEERGALCASSRALHPSPLGENNNVH